MEENTTSIHDLSQPQIAVAVLNGAVAKYAADLDGFLQRRQDLATELEEVDDQISQIHKILSACKTIGEDLIKES